MELNPGILKQLLRGIIGKHTKELTCEECFEQIDFFIELELQGRKPAASLPLVRVHLAHCNKCRELYNALSEAIRHIEPRS